MGEQLGAAGLVNEATPGFEAIEHALVLLEPPHGRGGEAVVVKETETFEEFLAAASVRMDAFVIPEQMRAEMIATAAERWRLYQDASNPDASTSPRSPAAPSAPPAPRSAPRAPGCLAAR